MRPVNHRQDAGRGGAAANLGHREAHRRHRRDVAEKNNPGVRRHPLPQLRHQRLVRPGREINRLADVVKAPFPAEKLPGVVTRAVFMVGGQHLVPRPQRQRPGHHVQRKGGVGHINQVIRPGPDILP